MSNDVNANCACLLIGALFPGLARYPPEVCYMLLDREAILVPHSRTPCWTGFCSRLVQHVCTSSVKLTNPFHACGIAKAGAS